MHIAVRVRRLLARHPSIYWLVCIAVALTAGAIVRQQLVALDEARNSWSTTREVMVATIDHRPGDTLRTELVALPVAAIPPTAIDELRYGAVSRQHVDVGEVVVVSDVVTAAGPAARAEAGQLVVGLVDPQARGAAIGLDVQIAADGVLLTRMARIVDVADDVIFVATAIDEMPAVAAAAHEGSATLIFVP